jgi:hypothetical protein
MIPTIVRHGVLALAAASVLQAATPDISNLTNCIDDVRHAAVNPPYVLTFDSYATNYAGLIADLQSAMPNLPYVYQRAAAKPLIKFLKNLGEERFLEVFGGSAGDPEAATLQQIIPDAVLAVLSQSESALKGVYAFKEIVSDLYEGFLSDEVRLSKQTGRRINPPTYGVIPPLVKFGNAESGPYTWPGDATYHILGMGCGIVSLPPEQLNGGLLAWSSLGHETGGHDVTHADKGLLEELAQKVHAAVLLKFRSQDLANYWANCIDESVADVCGYLNMGPSLGVGLIGYFRALGDGKLRTVGSKDDPHPIDLLRGYLAAAVAKRLHFRDAAIWSQTIAAETHKDDGTLYLADSRGRLSRFPVSFSKAVQSTDVVAQTIMESKLASLEGHSLQQLQDWTDQDQIIVNNLSSVLRMNGQLPASLRGPGFYASYVIASATQAALEHGADIPQLFNEMQSFLATMNQENPTWSKMPTPQSMALVQQGLKEAAQVTGKPVPRVAIRKLPPLELE